MSPKEIASSKFEDLIDFIMLKGKNRFSDPSATAKLLKKAARDSYRLDQTLYDPLNTAIAASFNSIKALENKIKVIDKAILKAVKGLNSSHYQCLLSIKDIGPVIAAGILAEIGDISRFKNQAKLAKYAGLTWRKKQSGNFTVQNTYLTKTDNKFLRYYLIEAVSSMLRYNDEYKAFYEKNTVKL